MTPPRGRSFLCSDRALTKKNGGAKWRSIKTAPLGQNAPRKAKPELSREILCNTSSHTCGSIQAEFVAAARGHFRLPVITEKHWPPRNAVRASAVPRPWPVMPSSGDILKNAGKFNCHDRSLEKSDCLDHLRDLRQSCDLARTTAMEKRQPDFRLGLITRRWRLKPRASVGRPRPLRSHSSATARARVRTDCEELRVPG
jgi:hypothetical protein